MFVRYAGHRLVRNWHVSGFLFHRSIVNPFRVIRFVAGHSSYALKGQNSYGDNGSLMKMVMDAMKESGAELFAWCMRLAAILLHCDWFSFFSNAFCVLFTNIQSLCRFSFHGISVVTNTLYVTFLPSLSGPFIIMASMDEAQDRAYVTCLPRLLFSHFTALFL